MTLFSNLAFFNTKLLQTVSDPLNQLANAWTKFVEVRRILSLDFDRGLTVFWSNVDFGQTMVINYLVGRKLKTLRLFVSQQLLRFANGSLDPSTRRPL